MRLENFISGILSCFLCLASCGHDHDEKEHDEDNHHQEGIIIEPDKAMDFGIVVDTVMAADFHDVIKTSGSIEVPNSEIYTVTAKKSGIITLASDIAIGKEVRKEETLGTISSSGMQGGDVNQAALANLAVARKEYERLKSLHDEGLVTTSVFLEAERALHEAEAITGKGRVPGGTAAVISEIEGNIRNIFVTSGEYIEAGQPVATVAKNTILTLKADVPARLSKHIPEILTANFISEGVPEIVKLSERNGKKISGSNTNSVSNGYIPVYFSFTGNSLENPGGFAEVYLICAERKNVISVPRDALIEIQGNKYVYLLKDDHEYEKILVKTGESDGEKLEIIEGLKEGDRVVVKGASIVRMAEISSVAPPAHTHTH